MNNFVNNIGYRISNRNEMKDEIYFIAHREPDETKKEIPENFPQSRSKIRKRAVLFYHTFIESEMKDENGVFIALGSLNNFT